MVMRRAELEHTIRAATAILEQESVIVIGSQAILGSYTEGDLPPQDGGRFSPAR